jgi:hypothetical protein
MSAQQQYDTVKAILRDDRITDAEALDLLRQLFDQTVREGEKR